MNNLIKVNAPIFASHGEKVGNKDEFFISFSISAQPSQKYQVELQKKYQEAAQKGEQLQLHPMGSMEELFSRGIYDVKYAAFKTTDDAIAKVKAFDPFLDDTGKKRVGEIVIELTELETADMSYGLLCQKVLEFFEGVFGKGKVKFATNGVE